MSDLFADYGRKATSTAAAPLVGAIRRRADARTEYTAMVAKLHACSTKADVEALTAEHRSLIAQFAAELEFLWSGDADFLGLEKEIEWARARVDDGLDFPRWEVSQPRAEERN